MKKGALGRPFFRIESTRQQRRDGQFPPRRRDDLPEFSDAAPEI